MCQTCRFRKLGILSDKWWVMSEENWVRSDEWWFLKNQIAPKCLPQSWNFIFFILKKEMASYRPQKVPKGVFGWGDFREDGKHIEEKWVKNNVYYCFVKEGKYWKWKIGRKFSLPGSQISSSQIRRKIVGRKVDLWHFYTNTLWNQVKKKRKKEKKREPENESCTY